MKNHLLALMLSLAAIAKVHANTPTTVQCAPTVYCNGMHNNDCVWTSDSRQTQNSFQYFENYSTSGTVEIGEYKFDYLELVDVNNAKCWYKSADNNYRPYFVSANQYKYTPDYKQFWSSNRCSSSASSCIVNVNQ